MTRTETFSCFIVSCDSSGEAYQAYQAVKDRFFETGNLGLFDAAVFDRRETGRPGICRAPHRPEREAVAAEEQWGLAPGLVIALSPGAAVGSDLDTAQTRSLAVLEVFAAYVARGMTRAGLQELGSALDASEAALAVVSAVGRCEGLEAVMAPYGDVTVRYSTFDIDALERDVREAEEPGDVLEAG